MHHTIHVLDAPGGIALVGTR